MAQKQQPKQQETDYESLPFDDKFLANLTPFSLMGAKRLLKMAWWEPEPGPDAPELLMPWNPEFTAPFCPLLISNPGTGKSIIIESLARELEWEYRRIPMGDVMEEDNMGVVDSEHKDDEGHHTFSMPACMPMDKPHGGREGGRGIAHFDECGTGTPTHQNMFSMLLSAGYRTGVFGHTIRAGWFLVGSMNPESAKYHLNQQLDPRVRDRLFPIFVVSKPDEVLHYLGQTDKLPEFLYGFLMMYKDTVMSQVSARSWEMIGAFAWRYALSRMITRDEFINFTRGKLPKAAVEELSRYMKLGDDPVLYPLSAKKIMGAKPDEHKEHCKRMKSWARKSQDSLVGATAFDIARYFTDVDITFDDHQLANLLGITELIPRTDLAGHVLNAATGRKDLALRLVEKLKNQELGQRLAELMDRSTKHQREEAG